MKESSPRYNQADQTTLDHEELLKGHLRETNWKPDLPHEEWAEEAGFQNIWEFRSEIHRAKIAREYLKNLFIS